MNIRENFNLNLIFTIIHLNFNKIWFLWLFCMDNTWGISLRSCNDIQKKFNSLGSFNRYFFYAVSKIIDQQLK